MKSANRETLLAAAQRVVPFLPELLAVMIVGLLMSAEFTPLDGYDWLRMHVWHKLAFREAWLGTGWSEWNPFVGMGRPTFAEIEAAIFYPFNFVFLLGPAVGLAAGIGAHLVVAIRGMLGLMQRLGVGQLAAWFAALAWALGAPLMGRLQSGQIQVVFALVWLPWLLVFARDVVIRGGRRASLKLAGVAALVVLAGSPPMAWIMGWATLGWMFGLLILERRPGGLLRTLRGGLSAGVLALGLTAVQVWPFLELLGQGNRGADGVAFALNNSMTAQSWWSLLTARLGERFFYWEYNLHGGALLLMLGIVGMTRGRRVPVIALWSGLGVVFALLAMGGATPLLPTLAEWIPGWDALRYSSRYAIVSFFAIVVLAGFGVDAIREVKVLRGRRAHAIVLVLLGINGASLLGAYFDRQAAYAERFEFATEQKLSETLPRLESGQPPWRVLVPGWEVRANAGMGLRYSSVTGFGNPTLRSVWDVLHQRSGVPTDPQDPVNLPAEVFIAPSGAFRDLALDLRWDMATLSFVKPVGSDDRFQFDGGEIKSIDYAADRIGFKLEAPRAGTLLIAEPWYPGWSAQIDGADPQPVERADGWKRAVEVPAGASEVVLHYRQNGLRAGAMISLATLLWWGGLWRRSRGEVVQES
ncbi:MAG: hypothetical protein SynsKO_03370 [Synoicihabitans sp.]